MTNKTEGRDIIFDEEIKFVKSMSNIRHEIK